MTLNKVNIKDMRPVVLLHQARADTLIDHVGNGRVTHTIRSVIRLCITLNEMVRRVQADTSYNKLFARAFEKAHDPKGGSMDVRYYPEDDTIFIRGSFRMSELRERLLTVPQESDTVIEGVYRGKNVMTGLTLAGQLPVLEHARDGHNGRIWRVWMTYNDHYDSGSYLKLADDGTITRCVVHGGKIVKQELIKESDR
jgi:hypothetical protein